MNYTTKKLASFILLILFTINSHSQCWKSVETGNYHTIAIKSDGTLWSWGRDMHAGGSNAGCLGLGPTIHNQCTPAQIGNNNDWVTISAANAYSLAIKSDGTLWAWGSGSNYGNLGILINNSNIPTQVGTDNNWKSVSAGYLLAMAIKTDGTLWGWSSFVPNGIPLSGISQKTPMQLGTENNWKEISCGSDHNLALKNDNTLWSCGKNFNGQLGIGASGSQLEQNSFTQIGTETNWKSISAGTRFSLAIKNNGTIWGWGKNNFYQLGIGTNNQITTPIQIGNQTDWLKISTGDDVGFGIKTNNSLWGWGRNGNGQLGLGNATQQTNPTQIGLNTNWTSISANQTNSAAIKSDNTLWCSGYNFFGGVGITNGSFSTYNSVLNFVQIKCSTAFIANDDTANSIYGTNGVVLNNVLTNDLTYGIQAINNTNVKLNFVSSTNTGITLNTTSGAINIASSVPIGTYTLIYMICDPNEVYCSLCGDIGIVTINVIPLSPINAVNDDFSSTPINFTTGGTTPSVLSNDTLNGIPVNSNEIVTSLTNNGGLFGSTISPNGIINVPINSLIGTYILTYSICQTTFPTNCDTATVTIKIIEPILETPNIIFGLRANNAVRHIELQSDGKIIIVGFFTAYNNITRTRIARLNTNLTLDTSFISTGPTPSNTTPYETKVQSDNKIIVVGNFTGFSGGSNGRGIARLNPNGSIDTSFNTGGIGFGTELNGIASSCALQQDGKILVGGSYIGKYNGINIKNLIRLNSNGTLDSTFNYHYTSGTPIYKIVVQSDGKIIVGGISSIQPGSQQNIFRLNNDGSLDTSFITGNTGSVVHSSICTSCYNPIENIILQADGKIIIVGAFNTYNGIAKNNIVRLNIDGSVDNTFNVGTATNRVIKDLVIENDGKMIISGEFTTYNGINVNKIIRLNPNGTIDSTFSSGSGTNDSRGTGFVYNNIQNLYKQNDGKIILGGMFTAYNGISALNITRIKPSIAGSQSKGIELFEAEEEIISNETDGEKLKIYPNPNNGNFTIQFDVISENNSVEIYSVLGQKVFEKSEIKTNTIEISNLEKGLYFVKVNNQNISKTKKVLVN